MRRVLTIAMVLAGARLAHADDAAPKSPAVATWLSVGVTSAGLVLGGLVYATGARSRLAELELATCATAFAVGPSVGQLYAGRTSITLGGALRLGGFVVAVAGVFALAGECDDSEDDPHGCDSPRKWPAAAAMFGIGAAAFATGMVWDLVTAGDEARRSNRTHLSLAPMAAGAGLALAGRF